MLSLVIIRLVINFIVQHALFITTLLLILNMKKLLFLLQIALLRNLIYYKKKKLTVVMELDNFNRYKMDISLKTIIFCSY
jgi:hypothetical protein